MYPFLGLLPAPLVPLFFGGSYVIIIIFYFAGKGLAYLRWGGKFCPTTEFYHNVVFTWAERITATIKGEVKED